MMSSCKAFAASVLALASISVFAAPDQPTRDRAVTYATIQRNKSCDWLAGAKMLNAMLDEDQKANLDFKAEKIPPGVMHDDERIVRIIKAFIAQRALRTQKLDGLVSQCGWPTISEYGDAASFAAFLLLQHAEQEWKLKYIDTIRALAMTGEFKKANYAFLHDRIQIDQGKPQRYGSQVMKLEDGSWTISGEIEDPAKVDERRHSMDVMPTELCVYLAMMEDGPTTVSYPPCHKPGA